MATLQLMSSTADKLWEKVSEILMADKVTNEDWKETQEMLNHLIICVEIQQVPDKL